MPIYYRTAAVLINPSLKLWSRLMLRKEETLHTTAKLRSCFIEFNINISELLITDHKLNNKDWYKSSGLEGLTH